MDKVERFEKLYKDSKSKLYQVAFSVVKNRDAAEDILIDSYMKAWNKFHEYDPSKKFVNWMTTIVKNTAIDHGRKQSKLSSTFSFENAKFVYGSANDAISSFEIEDKSSDLYRNLEKSELMDQLLNSINQLPDDLKQVMVPFFENYSYNEISESTNLAVSTVRARVHRAKKILRSSLNHENFANF